MCLFHLQHLRSLPVSLFLSLIILLQWNDTLQKENKRMKKTNKFSIEIYTSYSKRKQGELLARRLKTNYMSIIMRYRATDLVRLSSLLLLFSGKWIRPWNSNNEMRIDVVVWFICLLSHFRFSSFRFCSLKQLILFFTRQKWFFIICIFLLLCGFCFKWINELEKNN